MKISKTAFKEYARCNRIYPLERLYLQKLDTNLSYFDEESARDLLETMFDIDTGEDLIYQEDEQIQELMKYYEEVERLTIDIASRKLNIELPYFSDTKKQTSFSFKDDSGHEFYSYLDGFGQTEDEFIVVEVKATTSKSFLEAGSKENPIFINQDNIFKLTPVIPEDDKVFYRNYEKLFNMFSANGKYVFDLAVERYIIENSIKQKFPSLANKKGKYYLGVLNSNYVFSGEYINAKPNYTDDLVVLIDLTEITEQFLEKISEYKNQIVEVLLGKDLEEQRLGKKCGFKSQGECIFFNTCFPTIKQKGSITEYIMARKFGPHKYTKEEMFNRGIKKIGDIPFDWLENPNNIIQYNSFMNNTIHYNKDKIAKAIKSLKYPIYHLDFESFNCPLPRFKGEKPYMQSLFQYSIHIERVAGKADILKDNYSFLASDHSDVREELIKEMIKVIDLTNGGTVLVYNKSFESARIKELANIFPEYKNELLKINEAIYDLLDIVKTSKNVYLELGYSEEESKEVNFYHNDLQGSYSIKKVLPIFSNLSYKDLEVQHGGDAILAYVKMKDMEKEDIEVLRNQLLAYCRQDTWAMFLILDEFRKI